MTVRNIAAWLNKLCSLILREYTVFPFGQTFRFAEISEPSREPFIYSTDTEGVVLIDGERHLTRGEIRVEGVSLRIHPQTFRTRAGRDVG